MRRTAVQSLVILACVISVHCGGSSDATSTAPSSATGSSTGSGSSGGSAPVGSDTVRNTSEVTDSRFDDGDWDDIVETYGATGSGGGGHLSFNGQAGADYRQISIRINTGGSDAKLAVFAVNRHAVHFPSTDGALLWVDYSEASINQAASLQYSAPAIRQNGKLYTLVPGAGAIAAAEGSWTDHALTHLTQNDFRTIGSATEHPDFSKSGGRMEFGFMRLQVGQGDTKGGIDNYRLVLYRN
jgi:ABC-type glycerol-3-phosphate transport system substrate-binding protein